MQNDVHFAALRAAARVAFGVAVLGGCSGAEEPADGSLSSASEINRAPCHDAGATKPKKSCDEVIASAFADAGADDFVWNDPTKPRAPVSSEVKACCEERLGDRDGGVFAMPYRWSCCAAIDDGAGDPAIGMACTPWGPPVPPSMRRARLPRGVA